MGLLLADWSVELFRARRKKAKKAKMMEKMEKMERVEKAEKEGKEGEDDGEDGEDGEDGKGGKGGGDDRRDGGVLCLGCEKEGKTVEEARVAQEGTAKREERLGQLVGVEPGDVVAAVENLVAEAAQLRTE